MKSKDFNFLWIKISKSSTCISLWLLSDWHIIKTFKITSERDMYGYNINIRSFVVLNKQNLREEYHFVVFVKKLSIERTHPVEEIEMELNLVHFTLGHIRKSTTKIIWLLNHGYVSISLFEDLNWLAPLILFIWLIRMQEAMYTIIIKVCVGSRENETCKTYISSKEDDLEPTIKVTMIPTPYIRWLVSECWYI